jgi:hypothetical protein
MEVRFTIKGNTEETVFSPVADREGNIYLHTESIQGENSSIPLHFKECSHILKLKDYDIFEESPEIIDERLLGLSGEWMEAMENGFDVDGDSDVDRQKPGYSPDDIFVENKPFSLKQLIDLIDSKDIELDPSFQRNFVWDNTRQSRLIESIFLGLPLPSIYLSQYDDGTLTIVDGLQRLNTIRKFMKGELRLSNLEYLEECNGKTFSQLSEVLTPLRIRRFSQTQIMCFVIDYRSPNKLKYDLFRRLNTGGKPLNNQEIRNCLSRVPLQKALKEMVSSAEFRNATDGSVKDTRMDAQESALRFMYFYDQYNEHNALGDYSGNMDSALDEYVEKINRRTDFQNYISSYLQSLSDAFTLFGKYAFRKVYTNYEHSRRNQVNKLLMMTICVLLAKHRELYRKGIEHKKNLTPELANLIANDPFFFNAITWSTNSKVNINYVFNKIKTILFDNYLIDNE